MSNYKDREREYITKIEKTPLPSNTKEYLTEYIQAMSFRHSPVTRYNYLLDVIMFLDYLENPTIERLAEMKTRNFDKYLMYLTDYETKNGTRSYNKNISLKRRLSALRSFYDYLARTYDDESDLGKKLQVAYAQIQKVMLPKLVTKKVITYMDKEEMRSFRSEVENASSLSKTSQKFHEHTKIRDVAIMDLFLSTGIRVSELVNLDVKDIDMEHYSFICIRKGGFPDLIYFSDTAAESLREWLRIREDFISDTSTENDKKALFLSLKHHRMTDRAIRYLVSKYSENSVPQKKISPHKLRATFATALYTETRDIYAVATSLGHSSVNTTKQYYAHISEDIKQENRNKIEL